MRLATILSLGASALLGVGALFVARVWMPQPGADAEKTVATVPVVAARADIAYGARLEAANLTVVQMPSDAAPDGAYSSIAEVIGLDGGAPVALMPLGAREPLLPSKLSGAGARASLASMIAPGMRAYTIKVSDVAGVGGHALPGDRVDVVLAREQPGADGQKVLVDVVIQNARLLGLNLNADPASTDKAEPRTATLEVSVEDAGRLSVAGEVGVLSLALRRTGSTEVEAVRQIDLRGPATAAPARAVRAVRRAAPKASSARALTIVHGDQRVLMAVPADRSGVGA